MVAPDVPNGHVAGLGVPLDQPHVLAAALLVQRRDGDADDLAVVGRVEAELRFLQSLLHRGDDAAVPGLDDDHASLGYADRGQLVERRGIAVVLDRDAIDQRGAGPAGPDGLDLLGQSIDALLHPALGLGQLRLDRSDAREHDGAIVAQNFVSKLQIANQFRRDIAFQRLRGWG